MDNDTLREMMTDTNFFHHNPHFYLGGSLANPSAVVRDGMNFLSRCKALEPVLYECRYKGTPFYWIGCAAFLSHDYATAAFLFDAAASEDMREERDGVHAHKRIPPALRFLRAKGKKQTKLPKHSRSIWNHDFRQRSVTTTVDRGAQIR